MRKPLYAISQEYAQAYDALFGDDALPEEAIRDTLAAIQGEFEIKALNIAALIKNMMAEITAMKDAEYSINERRKRLEKRVENLENYLLVNMQGAGFENEPIESPEHYIVIRKCPVSLKIETDAFIPPRFIKTKYIHEPDKIAIKEFLSDESKVNTEEAKEFKGVKLTRNIKLVIK